MHDGLTELVIVETAWLLLVRNHLHASGAHQELTRSLPGAHQELTHAWQQT